MRCSAAVKSSVAAIACVSVTMVSYAERSPRPGDWVAGSAVRAVGEMILSANANPPAGTAIKVADNSRFLKVEFMGKVLSDSQWASEQGP